MKTVIWLVEYRVLLFRGAPSEWYKKWFNTEIEALMYKEAIKDVWSKYKCSENYSLNEICCICKQDIDFAEYFSDRRDLWGTDPTPIRSIFVEFLNRNAT